MNCSSFGQNNLQNSDKELLQLAHTTNNFEIANKLKNHPVMIIRRALVRNPYTPVTIIDSLAFDQTSNVSYMATKNPKCSVNRIFDESTLKNPCVLCSKKESFENCKTCKFSNRDIF